MCCMDYNAWLCNKKNIFFILVLLLFYISQKPKNNNVVWQLIHLLNFLASSLKILWIVKNLLLFLWLWEVKCVCVCYPLVNPSTIGQLQN